MSTLLTSHTHFSLLEAIGKPGALLEKAHELWYTTVAMTDYNGMYWAVEFYKTAKQLDIKPLLWVELGFTHSLDALNELQQPSWTITLIAKNTEGYHLLLKAVSAANMDGLRWGHPTIDVAWLRTLEKNCVWVIGAPQSWLWVALKGGDLTDQHIELVHLCDEALWQCVCTVTWRDHTESRTLKHINHSVVACATKAWVRICVTPNNHYIDSNDRKPYEVALWIKDWKRVFDEDRRRVRVDQALIWQNTIKKNLQNQWFDAEQIDVWIETTNSISTERSTSIDLDTILFPTYVSPEHIETLYTTHKDALIQ